MRLRQGKVGKSVLLAFALFCVVLFLIEVNSIRNKRAGHYDEKVTAANTAQQAFDIIKASRESLGIPIDEINDPNRTGLIGYQFSLITSGRNDLQSKLTSTNPNFAALLVELLYRCGVRKDDLVAIGWNGSYPALNIALLSAVKALNVKPVIITSLTASTWGANDPKYTWLDMERVLNQAGILQYRSAAASLGGEDDNGQGLSPEGRAILDSALLRNGITKINASTLDEQIEKRLDIYQPESQNQKLAAFVNIDRSASNLGDIIITPKTGILSRRDNKIMESSLIGRMLAKGIPVINILDVNNLAEAYSLPIAPAQLPKVGKGKLFIEPRYSVNIAIVFVIVIIIVLFFVIRYDLEYYLLPRKQQAEIKRQEGK